MHTPSFGNFLDDHAILKVFLREDLGLREERIVGEHISPKGLEHSVRVKADHMEQPRFTRRNGVHLRQANAQITSKYFDMRVVIIRMFH